jgi:hypothetical protein
MKTRTTLYRAAPILILLVLIVATARADIIDDKAAEATKKAKEVKILRFVSIA